jgi:hypothetical protein
MKSPTALPAAFPHNSQISNRSFVQCILNKCSVFVIAEIVCEKGRNKMLKCVAAEI